MRDEQLLIRLTKEEKKAFEDSANLNGISLSAWCRQKLRMAAVKDLRDANAKIEFLK